MRWLLEDLPAPLRTVLLHASEGSAHLSRAAALAAAHGLDGLARDLTLAAWERSPLDSGLARQAAKLHPASQAAKQALVLQGAEQALACRATEQALVRQATEQVPVSRATEQALACRTAGRPLVRQAEQQPPVYPSERDSGMAAASGKRPALSALEASSQTGRELAQFVAANTAKPAELAYYQRLAQRREHAKLKTYLSRQGASEPGNLFWARLGLLHAAAVQDWEWAEETAAPLPAPLACLVRGELALARGDARAALANFKRQAGLWSAPGLNHRLALAYLMAGELDQAAAYFELDLALRPWRTASLLALYDVNTGRAQALAPLPGSVAILLYSFRKPQDLDSTLASLAASRLDQAAANWRICALDNGSGDDTAAVLAAWADRLGPDRFEAVSLPVNVGAPAARNWLAALPATRQSDFAVYLDDDVSLPPDWLLRLGAAVHFYPRAGVYGCRVKDHYRPSHIQSADVFLLPGDGQQGQPPLQLTTCHHQTLDLGQFSHMRPCATVTGCCHLFRTATLSGNGFDLRYSPSQYDDLDHDIRLLLAGLTPVYQGHLAVGHFKSTGRQGQAGQPQFDIGFANQYKLHHSYTPQQFLQAADTADTAAWHDALAKWRSLPQ